MHENVHREAAADPAMLQLAQRLFRPLARLFLRRGLNYHELKTILAWSLVRSAMTDPEFAIKGRRVFRHSISHAAAMTGMTRRETGNFADMPEPLVAPISERTRRAMRVIFAWRTAEGYQDAEGEPLCLPLRGPAPSFEALAEKERRDVPPRAIADLLVAEGRAEWRGRDLSLLPAGTSGAMNDVRNDMQLAGASERFLQALDMACNDRLVLKPRVREVLAHDIPAESLDELRDVLHARMEAFNAEIESLLGGFSDPAANDRLTVGLGSFSYFDRNPARNDRQAM